MAGVTVAALYVERGGVYWDLPDVDPWDEARDARLYAGPWPVVAHPPCARWCRLAGFVEAIVGYERGDDGGCFQAALDAVRAYGGVIEHPAESQAWRHFGLPRPPAYGWSTNMDGGWSAYVEQDRYGHVTRKPTWLYAYGVELPELRFGYRPHDRENDPGWWVRTDRPYEHKHGDMRMFGSSSKSSATPVAFRDVLLDMARSAGRVTA
jgi:hypothetical protein